jgi:hypothetical protein
MRRVALLSASLLLLVAAPAPASAASMPPATHRAISKLIDSFVKDVVLRRNLAAGWALVGPDMRFGTTRRAWVRGTGVTAQEFPAVGDDFSHSWELKDFSPGHADITVSLRSTGKNAEVTFSQAVARKLPRGWVVDDYVEMGLVRTGSGHRGSCAQGSCAITGVNDFGAGSTAHELGLPSPERGRWMWVGLGAVGTLLLGSLVGLLLYIRIRDRRAVRAYEIQMGRR